MVARKKTKRSVSTSRKKAKAKPRKKPAKRPSAKQKARSRAAKKGWETRRTNQARERARKEHARMQRQDRAQRKREQAGKPARKPKRITKRQAEVIIPPDWKRIVMRGPINVDAMAAQVAMRLREKVIGVHDPDSFEAQIVMHLIAAEQAGTFNEELYALAGVYPDYDTASEIYTLWLYSGN